MPVERTSWWEPHNIDFIWNFGAVIGLTISNSWAIIHSITVGKKWRPIWLKSFHACLSLRYLSSVTTIKKWLDHFLKGPLSLYFKWQCFCFKTRIHNLSKQEHEWVSSVECGGSAPLAKPQIAKVWWLRPRQKANTPQHRLVLSDPTFKSLYPKAIVKDILFARLLFFDFSSFSKQSNSLSEEMSSFSSLSY